MSRIAAVAVCLVLAVAPAFAQSKAVVQQLADRWANAYNKGDFRAIGGMYTADAYVLPDHGPMTHGRAAIEALFKSDSEHYQGDLKLTTLDVQPLGSNAAREIGTYSITTKSQPPQQEVGKYATVLRKVGGKWLIATDIWNTDK